MAEYTNANFVSQHTVFTETADPTSPYAFPYPRESSTNLSELLAQRLVAREVTAEDGIVDLGLYLSKKADGELIFPFLKTGYLTDWLMTILTLRPHLRLSFQEDDAVHAAYADKLLPRAISYSAGLLDYFFRGKLDFELIAGKGQGGQMGLTITNTGSETMDGTFGLYAENENRGESPEVSVAQSLGAGATSERISFTPTRRAKKYVLVFQGRLGAEAEGAVAGIVKPYEAPPALPIQQTASFTGEEQTYAGTERSGYSSVTSGASHSRSGTQQRATGAFFPTYLTKYLRRIELTFDTPPDPATNEVVLKINGRPVGTAWSRETHPDLDPQTWEVVLNLPRLYDIRPSPSWPYTDHAYTRLPRSVVAEAENGTRVAMPFLWWRSAWTYASRTLACHCGGGYGDLIEQDYTATRTVMEVEFGDGRDGYDGFYPVSTPHTAVGFIPLTSVAATPWGPSWTRSTPRCSCRRVPWGPTRGQRPRYSPSATPRPRCTGRRIAPTYLPSRARTPSRPPPPARRPRRPSTRRRRSRRYSSGGIICPGSKRYTASWASARPTPA